MKMSELTVEYLKECLVYNPLEGNFTWLERPLCHFNKIANCNSWNARYAGKHAGNIKVKEHRTQYSRIAINNISYRAHRLAWFYKFEFWPDEIDHIDGDGLNNKISNLRNVSVKENRKNMPLQLNNTSGLPGISWDKKSLKWHSYIKTNGYRVSLGYYLSFFEACCIRKAAQNKLMFHNNHGRVGSDAHYSQL